jgi:hypothetical protein
MRRGRCAWQKIARINRVGQIKPVNNHFPKQIFKDAEKKILKEQ